MSPPTIHSKQEVGLSEELTIDQLLRRQAAQIPNAIAIAATAGKPLTYRGLIDQVDYVAQFLAICGITDRDCVAIVLPNGPEMAVAFLGVSSGAISAPLNPGYREAEFDFYLSELNARALIVQSASDSPATTVAQKRNIPVIDLSPVVDGVPGSFQLRTEHVQGTSVIRRAEPTDVALILHTSGTTSRSKMVPLTHSNLLASARNIATSLGLTPDDRCLNVMPLFHIHGLVGALLSSLMAGSSVVCAPGFDGDRFFPWLETFQPTWYTAVPTIHQAVLDLARAKTTISSGFSLRFIRSSSSALAPQVMRGLENVFHVPVIEAYGMTEASHQICTNPLPPSKRKEGSVGVAAGPDVCIMDEEGKLLPSGEVGEVAIRGATVIDGYAGNPSANADSFTNGWFRTGDLACLDNDGYLFINGRLKEIINRGGEKISPIEIDQVLLDHPAVAEAIAFAVSHGSLGEDIAAAVVLRKQGAVTELELQQFVASRLAEFKVPRQIIVVEAIPKTATGKIQRIGLAEKLGVVGTYQNPDTLRTVAVTPRTQTEKALNGIWSAVLGLDVGLEDNFFHLGGNSIHTAQIISRIRESLGVELSFPTFFEAPTVAAMARVVATASQKLRSIKALPFPEDGTGALSFTQEALWFLDQLDPGNPAYNRPVFARLEGELKPSLLEKCLNEIVRRHSSLRTHFPTEDGEAAQRVYAAQHFSLPVTDISSLSAPERESQLRMLAAEEAGKPFDLAKGPTFRAKLVRVEERLHVLLATAHHIAIDGWSAEIFLQELQTLYDAFSAGRASPLAELSVQYLAFARWQRESADDVLMQAHIDYWKRQLGANIPPLNLSTDRPRSRIQTFKGAKRVFTLSKNLLEGLKAISRQQEGTLFMTLLAAFKILLHHYSMQQDIIVGTPFAGRNQIDTENMIGNFTTTLPLHTNLTGNPSFRELLARVRKTVQEAHAHQDIPFEKIVRELRLKRDSSRPAVYEVLFQLRNYPRDFSQSGELRVEEYEREGETSAFDMSLSILEDRNGLRYDLVYNTDLFDDATIERMAAQFDNLVKNIVANPHQKISDFPWITETKQRAPELSTVTDAEPDPLLAEGNNMKADHAKDRCVQELSEVPIDKSPASEFSRVASNLPLEQETIRAKCFHPSGSFTEFGEEEVKGSIANRFEKIVRQYPERIALETTRDALTYRELNLAANRVAHAILTEYGEGEEPVAVLFKHDIKIITAILGVLKAGKAYVPLDASYPRERIARMLEDSQAKLVVSDSNGFSALDELAQLGIHMINIDLLEPNLSGENPGLSLSSDTTAYIMYTSGSTGQPKGVVHNHRNVLQRIMVHTSDFKIAPEDRLCLLQSSSFSQSIRVIFGALLNGSALCLFDIKNEGLIGLAEWLVQEKITIYFSVPTVFRHFVSTATRQKELSLRLIYLGGETLTKADVDLYRKFSSPDCILVNSLFANESGPISQYFIDKETQTSEDIVPVGYGLQGKTIFLLDDAGHELGINCVGEIAVKSRYLSSGYWRRPDLTRAKFLPDRDGGDERTYLTGDLGLMRPDGCLEYLGRKDLQVKVKGYRIELAGIEMALLNLTTIKEAVVVAREDQDQLGDQRLVAYLVPNNHPAPSVSELRNLLKDKLPDYMVPSAFVFLDGLPLGPNGKVDRRALPDPGKSRPDLEIPFVAPRTPVEKVLAQIWAEVLSLDQIGVDDNFFDLGGHSLAATRVVSQVIKIFQLEVPLQSLFQAPTIAKMAAAITDYQTQIDVAVSPPTIIPRREKDQAIGLSFAQQRLWFLSKLDPQSPAYNQPKAIRLQGTLDIEILKRALETIITRHEVLRTTYSAIDGQPSQAVSHNVSIELPIIDLSGYAETEREAKLQSRIAEITERPFDLSRDLTLRATLLNLGPAESVLLLVTHHIASDGWSSEILWRELTILYEAFVAGEPNPLPELPIQYADYAVWQRDWVTGEVLEKQLSYWKTQLSGITSLELPTDRPRPAVQTYRGARQSVVFPKFLSDQLQDLSRKESVFLFMTLLAAMQALFHRYTGQEDIAVGSPIAGRTRFELENLIGFFVNTLVLRTDLSGNLTFRELLARVRKVALEAYEHQDLPFEKVVEEINPERTLSHTPLFKIGFAFQNIPRQTIELAGLTISPIEIEREPAKFDLTLYAWEEARGLKCSMVYNTDLFEVYTINRMLGHFETLLEGIVTNPDQRISDVPILTEAETHQLLVEWNGTKTDYPRDKCIHDLFEEQVERIPEAVAVVFDDKQLTYGELNRRANQLAHHLRKLGVGPETIVAICMERSLEMLVGMLGILKAGGGYVPLDPVYPKERLAFVLEDTKAKALLTQERLVGNLPDYNTRVLCLDSDRTELAQESELNPISRVSPENLAYVIYTSGTSGSPKGVMIEHKNLVNHLIWFNQSGMADKFQRLPVITKPTFDASLKQLLAPLLRGGVVWLLSDEVINEPTVLLKTLSNGFRTGLNCVPSLWSTFLDVIESKHATVATEALSVLFLGGEQLSGTMIRRTFLAYPHLEIWNLYGPTEATANAIVGRITRDGPITLGQPVTNTQVYILDKYLKPVPVGVPAVLYIGGSGLARGYLNQAALTAEKFIPDPFSNLVGARLYNTGDLARYLPDGNIEFLGRTDYQVKIRGFRIELGEIEAAIRQNAAVRDTVVVMHENAPGDKQLVGYVVSSQEQSPTVPELCDFLNQKLPNYMIPSAFVFLPALPLTPNGKVDRRALPAPDGTRPELEETFVAPRTQLEKRIAAIWTEVLKLERVGIHDNFFDLGGHSLLATRVISRVREAFQMEVPLRSLFEMPTVAGLAEVINKARAGDSENSATKISPVPRQQHRVTLPSLRSVKGSDVQR